MDLSECVDRMDTALRMARNLSTDDTQAYFYADEARRFARRAISMGAIGITIPTNAEIFAVRNARREAIITGADVYHSYNVDTLEDAHIISGDGEDM